MRKKAMTLPVLQCILGCIPAACTFEHLPLNVYTCITSTDKTSSGVYGSPIWNLYKAGIIEQEFTLTMSIKNFNWNET